VEPFLEEVDSLLVMTVNPGYGGQPFITETLPKIQQAAAWRRDRGLQYRIAVDGGVDFETVAQCATAGADTIISGTCLFQRTNLKAAVAKLRKLAEAAAQPRAIS
jgi:ribulose-phosphate 3-epimerase